MRFSPSTQRGAAFLTLVAILSAVAILFVIGHAAWQSKQRRNELPQLRAERVEFAAKTIRSWYIENASDIDAPAFVPPSSALLLSSLGVPSQWELSVAFSEPQRRGGIQYHVIGVWVAGDEGEEPAWNPATGTFTCPSEPGYLCDRYLARIDGYEIEAKLYGATVRGLRALAAATQSYFHSLWLADPDHNISKNYFRSCDAPRTELPCLDAWTALAPGASSVLEALNEPPARGYDAWGRPIQAMNGGANAANPPYRMAFVAETPWETTITVYAVQRL